MKGKQEKLSRYTYAYWFYFLSSWIILVIFLVFLGACYLTAFQEKVTISHLFLLIILLGMAAYLRMNALHYHQLILRLQLAAPLPNQPVKRPRPANRTYVREEQSYYER